MDKSALLDFVANTMICKNKQRVILKYYDQMGHSYQNYEKSNIIIDFIIETQPNPI